MTMLDVAVAFLLGALAAALHLAVTHARARLFCGGRQGLALGLLPLGLSAVAGCALLAVWLVPAAAWAALPGIAITRTAVLARIRHAK